MYNTVRYLIFLSLFVRLLFFECFFFLFLNEFWILVLCKFQMTILVTIFKRYMDKNFYFIPHIVHVHMYTCIIRKIPNVISKKFLFHYTHVTQSEKVFPECTRKLQLNIVGGGGRTRGQFGTRVAVDVLKSGKYIRTCDTGGQLATLREQNHCVNLPGDSRYNV